MKKRVVLIVALFAVVFCIGCTSEATTQDAGNTADTKAPTTEQSSTSTPIPSPTKLPTPTSTPSPTPTATPTPSARIIYDGTTVELSKAKVTAYAAAQGVWVIRMKK